MANNELPKASLGKIIGSIIKGGYQGVKTGYKSYKTASLTEKAAKLKKAQTLARTQKAAATRAANAKAAADAKKVVPKSKTSTTKTKTPATPKGKEPFVKSKARLAVENVAGQGVGYATFGTGNVAKKVLKNNYAKGIIGGGGAAYVINKIAEGKRPVKIKKK